jgi:2'-hydroxyisoflavone reductase
MAVIWVSGRFDNENSETGIYNATGLAKPPWLMPLDGIKSALNSGHLYSSRRRFPAMNKKSRPGPICRSDCKESGMARTKLAGASKGLTFRPLDQTARDTLAWFKSQPAERQAVEGS